MGSLGREGATEDAAQLPVIDISNPSTALGESLINAAEKYGFLYINPNGTGFTEEVVDRQFDLSRKFFSLPISEKNEYMIGDDNRGWTGLHGELLDPSHQKRGDFKEAFNMGEFVNGKHQQPMPPALSSHVKELADFEAKCKSLCRQIFRLIATGLQMSDVDWFSSRHHSPSGCTVRLLHYPALPAGTDLDDSVDIRCGAHSDYGSITLRFQRPSQPGLEILTPASTWAPVPVFPDGYKSSTTFPPILVNIADLLSYWTNGLLKSTVHRVVFPKDARRGGEDRYSIVYFCHPANDTQLIPVPSKMVEARRSVGSEEVGYGGGVSKQKAMTAKEHLDRRLAATYGFRMEKKTNGV